VDVFKTTEGGLAVMAPPVPLPDPGVNVTLIETFVPPPEGEVGCKVIEPLQVTPPFEQPVFETETVKLSGAFPPPLTLKKPPLGVIVYGPEPPVVTATFRLVPESATGFGVALNCD